MSDEQEPLEASTDDSETAPETAASDQPKDLPLPIVVTGVAIAVLVFGYVGWQRYQSLTEETMRELAEGMQQAFEEGTEEARRLAAEKAAAEAAAGAEQDPGSPLAPASTAPASQTKPSAP